MGMIHEIYPNNFLLFLTSNCSLNSSQKGLIESKNESSDTEYLVLMSIRLFIGFTWSGLKMIDAVVATNIAGSSFVKADVNFFKE